MSTDQRTVKRRATSVPEPNGFIPPGEAVDVAVLIVAYNSANEIGGLIDSLRDEAADLRLRVVIADNDSTDNTREIVQRYPDVLLVPTGGNLGYATGINTAQRFAGENSALLVLNPDLRVEPGAIQALFERMRTSRAGIVVPHLLEADGSPYPSLRREPTLATGLGEALFGAKLPTRPGWLSETVYDSAAYQVAHRIEWATGAALMIRADVARRLGDWDERFFLYSEEVDFFRRARGLGEEIWYEPAARMRHIGGASGASPQLEALMAVNRIRYMRKYHTAAAALAFRHTVVLREALRSYKAKNRQVCSLVMDESSWGELPGPAVARDLSLVLEDFPSGSVIIPAHNEAAVIARTLQKLAPVVATGAIEAIVACNGCTDDTAEIAGRFPGVRVLDVSRASKIAALNEAEDAASLFPRLYLDADIDISPTALRILFERLQHGEPLAARPAFHYDDTGASWPVRAFYRARRRLPSTDRALWGAGAYAVSREGRQRFGRFPELTGDDLFIDLQFSSAEKAVLSTPPVRVLTPRNVKSLMAILRRNYRGDSEFRGAERAEQVSARTKSNQTARTAKELVVSVTGPRSLFDAGVYASFVAAARLAHRRTKSQPRWERDESSRN